MAQLMPTPMAEPAGTVLATAVPAVRLTKASPKRSAGQRDHHQRHEGDEVPRRRGDQEGGPAGHVEVAEVVPDVAVVGQLRQEEAEDGHEEDRVTAAPSQLAAVDASPGRGRVASGAPGGHGARGYGLVVAGAGASGQGLLWRQAGGRGWSARPSVRDDPTLVGPALQRLKRPSPTTASEPGHGVSSFHLWWQGIDGGAPLVEVAATSAGAAPARHRPVVLLGDADVASSPTPVPTAPPTSGCSGTRVTPVSKAVNWGGYADIADVRSVLEGTPSPLPSTPDDPNTRDYPWQSRAWRYRLRMATVANGAGAARSPICRRVRSR